MFGLDEIVEMNKRATATGDRTATGLPEEGTKHVEDLPKAPPRIDWIGDTYQIVIPRESGGIEIGEERIQSFEKYMFHVAGGFTVITRDAFGAWDDPASHQTYIDSNVIYQVCVTNDGDFRDIMDYAVEVFKSETAIFAVKLGRCVTFTRQ